MDAAISVLLEAFDLLPEAGLGPLPNDQPPGFLPPTTVALSFARLVNGRPNGTEDRYRSQTWRADTPGETP